MSFSKKLSDIWHELKVKQAAGEILFGPSVEVKHRLREQGWDYKTYVFHAPSLFSAGAVVEEALSPEGKSALTDSETRARYYQLCRQEAEKLYPKPQR